MAYNKQTWKAGDKITAKKLNYMEEGIAAGGNSSGGEKFTVTLTNENNTWSANKSIAACIQAYEDGNVVECLLENHDGFLTLYPFFVDEDVIQFCNAQYGKDGGTGWTAIGIIDNGTDSWDALFTSIGGGSSETYETVAEIAVGEMQELEGLYACQPSDEIPLAKNLELFFNSADYPLEYSEDGTSYIYNFDMETGRPSGTPAYAVTLDGSTIVAIVSDIDLSNTTVRILKKASEPSGGKLPEVTSADNGKVLTVVDGAWQAAGGDELETILELELTEAMHSEFDGANSWTDGETLFPLVSDTDSLYFNSEEYPLSYLGSGSKYWTYNVDITADHFAPEDPSKPAYAITYDGIYPSSAVIKILSDEDLTGQTVTILKAKAAPSGGKFVVSLEHALKTVASLELSNEKGSVTGFYGWGIELSSDIADALNEENCYVGDRSHPLEKLGDRLFGYNVELDGGSIPVKVDPDDVAYYLEFSSVDYTGTFNADTNIGGQTVTIVQDDAEHFVADKSVAECIAAYEEGKEVECLLPLDIGQIVLNLAYALSQYHAIAFSNAATINSATLFEVAGVLDGSSDNWAVKQTPLGIPSTYKPTYEFGFTVTSDGQGGYTATADTGSTYSAITAALDETPNVIAKVAIPTGGTVKVLIDYDLNSGYLTCSKSAYSTLFGAPILVQLDISSSDVLTPRLITLTAST